MAVEYECPAEGCVKVYRTADELRGHIAGTMQYDETHKWRELPVSHHDLSNAERKHPGLERFDG